MGIANAVTFTAAAEVANARNVAVQLGSKQTRGATARNVKAKMAVGLYVSSDAAGDVIVNPVSGDVVPSLGASGKLVDGPITGTRASFLVKTDATGKANVILTNASDQARTVYLNAILGSGKVITSGPIAFLDD